VEGDHLIELVISDPWEWQTELGPGPLVGQVIERKEDYALVQLTRPVTFRGRRVEFLVAAPRHRSHGWNELLKGDTVPANFALAESDRDWLTKAIGNGVHLVGAMQIAGTSGTTLGA
jgi:hypothetical protein